MQIDHLRTYYRHDIGPVLSYSALEAQLGMPRQTLRHWATSRKNVRQLPAIYHARVHAWAKAHGYDPCIQYDPII